MESAVLEKFLAMEKSAQLAYADELSSKEAKKLAALCFEEGARTGTDVDWDVLARLFEVYSPGEYLEAAQATDDRLILADERRDRTIYTERNNHLYETPTEAEERHREADAQARRENEAAAKRIHPFLAMRSDLIASRLRSVDSTGLDALLSSVRRCIEEVGPSRTLRNIEELIQVARAGRSQK